jgi:hypothetical protein
LTMLKRVIDIRTTFLLWICIYNVSMIKLEVFLYLSLLMINKWKFQMNYNGFLIL